MRGYQGIMNTSVWYPTRTLKHRGRGDLEQIDSVRGVLKAPLRWNLSDYERNQSM